MSIPNPPNAPAGYVAEWTGSEWKVVPISAGIVPAKPSGIPDGYSCEWDGSEWVVTPPPPAPSPSSVTGSTIFRAAMLIQQVDFLATGEMSNHITPESKKEVVDYISKMANIVAAAQEKFSSGEAYAPTFPPMPTVMPKSGDSTGNAPFIQFVTVN